eukprot:gene10281-biopygen1650
MEPSTKPRKVAVRSAMRRRVAVLPCVARRAVPCGVMCPGTLACKPVRKASARKPAELTVTPEFRILLCAVWAAPCGAVRRYVTCGQRRVAPCGRRAVWAPPCGAVRHHGVPCGAVCAVWQGRTVWHAVRTLFH